MYIQRPTLKSLVVSARNIEIKPADLELALERMPVANVLDLQDLNASSYLYALLTDHRISEGLYRAV